MNKLKKKITLNFKASVPLEKTRIIRKEDTVIAHRSGNMAPKHLTQSTLNEKQI